MNEIPLVSVICPAFNAAETLRDCVKSVLRQSYQKFEIIIVDDGSIDNTLSVADDLANNDHRIRVISQANSGSCVARNVGFLAATGKYVSVIDADDLWPAWKLDDQVRILNDNPECIVIGGVRRFGIENKQFVWYRETLPFPYENRESYLKKLIQIDVNMMVIMNTFCAKKEIFIEDGWDPLIKTGHDWEVWIRLAKKHKFITTQTIYQYYRKYNRSTTRTNSIKIVVDSHIMVIKKHGIEILGSKDEINRQIFKKLIAITQTSLITSSIKETWYCIGKALHYKYTFFTIEIYKLIIKNLMRTFNAR